MFFLSMLVLPDPCLPSQVLFIQNIMPGVILGEFGFYFYFKLLPAPQRRSEQSQLSPPQRHSKLWELRSSTHFPKNDEKIARTILDPVILIESPDAIYRAYLLRKLLLHLDKQSISPPYWLVVYYLVVVPYNM